MLGAGGGIRTPEGRSRQIYSLQCLTASLPQQAFCHTKSNYQLSFSNLHLWRLLPQLKIENCKLSIAFALQKRGADERIRTADMLFTKQLLWPTELRRR